MNSCFTLVEYCQSKDKYIKPVTNEKDGKFITNKSQLEKKEKITEARQINGDKLIKYSLELQDKMKDDHRQFLK